MSNNFDSFYDDMIKDIKPAASDPKEINMNELGAKMEKAVKEAYEKGLKEPEEPKEEDN